MKDWIKELCPEIDDWQAELIAEQYQRNVEAEREACAKVCDRVGYDHEVQQGAELAFDLATAIRARGNTNGNV